MQSSRLGSSGVRRIACFSSLKPSSSSSARHVAVDQRVAEIVHQAGIVRLVRQHVAHDARGLRAAAALRPASRRGIAASSRRPRSPRAARAASTAPATLPACRCACPRVSSAKTRCDWRQAALLHRLVDQLQRARRLVGRRQRAGRLDLRFGAGVDLQRPLRPSPPACRASPARARPAPPSTAAAPPASLRRIADLRDAQRRLELALRIESADFRDADVAIVGIEQQRALAHRRQQVVERRLAAAAAIAAMIASCSSIRSASSPSACAIACFSVRGFRRSCPLFASARRSAT